MAKKTIVLSRDVSNVPGLAAAAAITPGMLIEETSAGKLQAHSAEGGYALPCFAIEDTNQNQAIGDAYAADEEVQNRIFKSGEIVYAWLKAGVAVTRGETLMSAGDGTLIGVADAGSGVVVKTVVGFAQTALDLSASGAVNTRIAVRVL